MIAIIVTAFGLMLGVVKCGDALKLIGVIVSIVIMLASILAILESLWSGMLLWQRLGVASIGIGIWLLLRPPRQSSRAKRQ